MPGATASAAGGCSATFVGGEAAPGLEHAAGRARGGRGHVPGDGGKLLGRAAGIGARHAPEEAPRVRVPGRQEERRHVGLLHQLAGVL